MPRPVFIVGILVGVLPGLLSLVACGTDMPSEPSDTPHVELRVALDVADADPVGITVEPDTGRRVLLDAVHGIYALTDDGATLISSVDGLPQPDETPQSAFTDIAALGQGRYALTAFNDGFLFDTTAKTLRQHFCYEPDIFDEEIDQSTLSVAYDPGTDRLYAQPQTIGEQDGNLMASQVGEFDRVTGIPTRWFPVQDLEFLAGGMAVESEYVLLLGSGTSLHRYDLNQPGLQRDADLADLGVTRIDGLAIDRQTDSLLILDGARDMLFDIPLADLTGVLSESQVVDATLGR